MSNTISESVETPDPEKIIQLKDISVNFGGLIALDGVSLEVETDSISGLIGPNGAGKTVLFNVLSGYYMPDAGKVYLKGKDITEYSTWQRARTGMARGFQQLRLFPEYSVRKNLVVAAGSKDMFSNVKTISNAREQEEIRQRANEILERIDLLRLAEHKAGELSHGQQKLVQFGILVILDPDVILLDEIMAGVNPNLAERMKEYIVGYNEGGITFFIVEHDVPSIMDLCDRIIVLDSGKMIASGNPKQIRNDQRVIDAYLG